MTDHYDRPMASASSDSGNLTLRVSAAPGCRRRAAYALRGVEKTNPPSEAQREAMQAGKDLEPQVLARYADDVGVSVQSAPPGAPLPWHIQRQMPDAPIVLSGTPDAVVMEGERVQLIEVKTTGHWHASLIRKDGLLEAAPQYAEQLACYVWLAWSAGHVCADTHIVLVYDRDGQGLDVHRLKHATAMSIAERILARWHDWPSQALAADLPGRDYAVSDWRCRFCDWRDTCWSATPADDTVELARDFIRTREALAEATAMHTVNRDSLRRVLDVGEIVVTVDGIVRRTSRGIMVDA